MTVVFLLAMAVACGGRRQVPEGPAEGPILLPEPVPFDGLRATLVARLPSRPVMGRLQGALLLAPPDGARLELYPPIGPPAVIAATDGVTFQAWVPSRGLWLDVPTADPDLQALLRGLVSVEDVVRVLTGRVPELADRMPAPSLDADRVALTWSEPSMGSLTVGIDGVTGLVGSLLALDPDGARLLAATVEGALDLEGFALPHEVVLELPDPAPRLDVEFQKWERYTVPDSALTLTAPEGVEPFDWRSVVRNAAER